MANYRKAPKLYHYGDKDGSKKNFVKIPQDLLEIMCNNLSGRQGNVIKVMLFLAGTIGNGSFGVSEEWICKSAGMLKSCYIEARKTLVSLGWVELSKGKIIVNFDKIREYDRSCDTTLNEEEGLLEPTDQQKSVVLNEERVVLNDEMGCVNPNNGSCDANCNREEQINNKEITTDVFDDFYNQLSEEYNIQKEKLNIRINKKLAAENRTNIDMNDFLLFWINIMSDLKDNRFGKDIKEESMLEYDIKTALTKYYSAYNTKIKPEYKLYKDDIIEVYNQEKYDKIMERTKNIYYLVSEAYASWFNSDPKKYYKISTYMRYRNLIETRNKKVEHEPEF